MTLKQCRFCDEVFELRPRKPGRADVCTDQDCQRRDRQEAKEPEAVKGWTAWEGKHTPVMTVATAHVADRINAQLRRHGHNACLPGISSYSYEHDQQVVRVLSCTREYTASEQEKRDVKADWKL